MIKVDNSAEKRIFYLTRYENEKDFISLRNIIIKNINTKQYSLLKTLCAKKYADQFSIFIFYKTINSSIKKIINPTIKRSLQQIDWFKVLVGDVGEIREVIKANITILKRQYPLLPNFEQYHEIFDDLYKTKLSNNDDLKKEFFKLFQDINVCPYCNRNFINPIYKSSSAVGGDNTKQSPDIEHFFPKSIYPFLSLSISNLLPSCAFCNKIKSNADTFLNNCLSPYETKDEDFEFEFELESSSVKSIRLRSKDADCKNSEILHLESLYNDVHAKYINDIFYNILKYPEAYKRYLGKYNISDAEYKKIFRNYGDEKDFNKQPLSKMTKDLFLQIKKFK